MTHRVLNSSFSGAKAHDYRLIQPIHMVKHPGMAVHRLSFLELFDPPCVFVHYGHNIAELLICQAIRTSGCRSKTAVSGMNKDFTKAPSQDMRLDMNLVWSTASQSKELLIELGQEHLLTPKNVKFNHCPVRLKRHPEMDLPLARSVGDIILWSATNEPAVIPCYCSNDATADCTK